MLPLILSAEQRSFSAALLVLKPAVDRLTRSLRSHTHTHTHTHTRAHTHTHTHTHTHAHTHTHTHVHTHTHTHTHTHAHTGRNICYRAAVYHQREFMEGVG